MSSQLLPSFKYHPDPIATGSVKPSADECLCCGRAHGYIYVGPVYAVEEYHECICPWCIADGSAHQKLHASFHDERGIGGRKWDSVPKSVVEEIAYRTPGFCGWQQEQWWTHCGDAAEFVGRAGHDDLVTAGQDAIAVVRESCGYADDRNWQIIFDSLTKDRSPTAYLFRCLKCRRYGGYWDCD